MKKTEFEKIYKAYAGLAHSVAYQVLKDYHMAMDVSQDLFVLLFSKIDSLDEEMVKFWIILNTRRIAIDYWRKHNKGVELPEEMQELAAEFLTFDVEEYLESKERLKKVIQLNEEVWEALLVKDPEWYDIMMRAVMDKEDYKSIAESKGITLGNLRTKLYRARSWVRTQFGDEYHNL